jgi:hypothetical protein
MAFITRVSLEKWDKAHGSLAPAKSFYTDWMSLLVGNIQPTWMAQAFHGQHRFMAITFLLAISLVLLLLLRSIQTSAEKFRQMLLIGSITLAGYALSCLVISLAGYAMAGAGLNSRITIGASFWLAFFLASLFAEAFHRRDLISNFSAIVAIIVALSFTSAMTSQLYSWKAVWDGEVQLLSKVDPSAHRSLGPGSLVVLNRPVSRNGVYGFQSSYDFIYAIRDLIGEKTKVQYIVASDYWKVHATRGKVVQRAGTYVLAEYRPSMAWVLEVESGKLRPMAAQEVLGGSDYP